MQYVIIASFVVLLFAGCSLLEKKVKKTSAEASKEIPCNADNCGKRPDGRPQ